MSEAQALWQPFATQAEQATAAKRVVAASGCYLHTADGTQILDAISSWWCKPLGHGNATIKQALFEQAERFEHTLLADLSHDPAHQLSQRLLSIAPYMDKVYYASDGANAVEIALKMSWQLRQLAGETQRQQFVALRHGYHGETLAALSVTELETYRQPFESLLSPCQFIDDIPTVTGPEDPLWSNAELPWRRVEQQLKPVASSLTALIIEPIVQGAGGMRIYSADFLRRLVAWAQAQGIHVIADEIMTGLGRTGRWLASDWSGIEPDFICLGKSLSGGWLPLSAVMTRDAIYQQFYSNGKGRNAFVHSHTFSGNPLACHVACAALDEMQRLGICEKAMKLQHKLVASMQQLAESTALLHSVRAIGAIAAAELAADYDVSELAQKALAQGVLLRPLGNTLYWLPPLTIADDEIALMVEKTRQALI